MSRSYRKPWVTDQQRGRYRSKRAKRRANKAVRRAEEVPNGKGYKKFSCSWDICDWSFYDEKPEARRK